MILGNTFSQWIGAGESIANLIGFGARLFASFGGL